VDLPSAARQLLSPIKADRDAAEGVLLKARAEAIPHLLEVLNAPADASIARAVLLLSALGARDALPVFYALIEQKRPSADERAFLARALAELLDGQDAFDDRARTALETLSADTDRYTRAFAAQAFGSLGDLRSKARVQALSQDGDAWVREKASAVLRKLQETEALAQQDTASSITANDFAALAREAQAGGGALKAYLDDLGDHRRAVRDAAIAELVRAGKSAVPFLLDKLNQPLVRARVGAATALGRIQATEAAGPLLIAATAPAETADENELRAVSLRALANCLTGMEEGLAPSILPLARERDRFVRAAALLCLGRLADRQGLAAIVAGILDEDPFVNESAAVALSEGVREDDSEIVRPLLLAFDKRPGPSAAVREAILIALSRVQITAPPVRVRVRHKTRNEVLGTSASTRKAAIVLLEKLYEESDPPPLTLTDDVLSRLADDHPEVRVVAAAFLQRHLEPGMAGAAKRLAAALARGEPTLGLLALDALRRHDTRDARAVVEAQQHRDAPVGARATELLTDWQPTSSEWVFVPRADHPTQPPRADAQRPSATTPPMPSTSSSTTQPPTQRPSRVRAVTKRDGETGTPEAVEAKDAPKP
jgi:HEAT repeat protein